MTDDDLSTWMPGLDYPEAVHDEERRLRAALAKLAGYVAALMDDPESVVAQQLVMEAWREANDLLGTADPPLPNPDPED